MMRAPSAKTCGFTLIELLIAVSVIGALAALLLPAVSAVKASAEAAKCKSNLRQCYMGSVAYSNDSKGLLPLTQVVDAGTTRWGQYIAPYLDQDGTGNLNGKKNWVAPVLRCTVLNRTFPTLMSANFGQVSAFGYVRNDRLYYDSSNNTLKGTSDWSNNMWPAVGGVPFHGFSLARITFASKRMFAGDGFTVSAGGGMEMKCHSMPNTSLAYKVADQNGSIQGMGYFYSYQWNQGNSGIPVIAAASSPERINSDVHRGMHSYVMCDGSIRALTDDYRDPNNGFYLSVTDPSVLP